MAIFVRTNLSLCVCVCCLLFAVVHVYCVMFRGVFIGSVEFGQCGVQCEAYICVYMNVSDLISGISNRLTHLPFISQVNSKFKSTLNCVHE